MKIEYYSAESGDPHQYEVGEQEDTPNSHYSKATSNKPNNLNTVSVAVGNFTIKPTDRNSKARVCKE